MGDKQFNSRLAFGLVVALVICATAVHLVHAYQMGRHAQTLHEQAKRAEEAGQTEQAAILLKRYLLFVPGDTDALLRYGEIMEKRTSPDENLNGNRWLAVAAFKQVLTRTPNNREVRDRLVALLFELEAYSEAGDQLEIQLQASPNDAGLETQLGFCHEKSGDYEKAAQTYEKVLEHDPAQVDCYTRLAALLYNHFGQSVEADGWMDKLVAANEQRFEAYLARGEYRMGRGQLDDAAKDMARAKMLAPSDAHVLVAAAELAYRRGNNEDARAAWNEGLKAHRETRNMYLGLATLEIADNHPDKAIACLLDGLKLYPDNVDLLHLLTQAYLVQNNIKAAEEKVAEIRKKGELGVADYLEALILLHRGQWGAAKPLLEKALVTLELHNPLAARMYVCLAQCYGELGDNDRCLEAYRRAIVLEPSLLPAQLGLATAQLAAGKIDEALSQYRQLAQLARPPEDVWILLGRTLLNRNLAQLPKNRAWDEIDSTLERAAQNERLFVPAAILRTDMLLAQGKADEARKTLEQARDRKRDRPALWTALANLTAQRGDLDGAERILAAARKELGDRFELRMTALNLGIGLEGADRKAKLLAYEQGIQAFTTEEQRRLMAALAEVHYRFGDLQEGERLTRELASRQPLNLPAAIAVLELALHSPDDALATRAVADLRNLEGDDGTWWRYGEANRLLLRFQRGDKTAAEDARKLLAEVAKRRPHWSRAAKLEAALCEMTGDKAGALKNYLKAFDLGEREPLLVFRLMVLLDEQGRAVEADEVMAKAQHQMVVPHGDFAAFAAQLALRVRQYERAAALARLAVPSDSRDPQKFIWLGRTLAAAERRSEAEEALRHAVEIRDTIMDTWIALIAFYANNDQVKEADEALRTMAEKLPPGQVTLALAVCEQALGRLDLAEKHYLEALAKRPSDEGTLQHLAIFYVWINQPRKAERALKALFDPTLRLPPETVPWARRQLALIRAESGDAAGYADALALLDANGRHSVADVRAAAFVKATREPDRAAALLAIEETMKTQPLAPDEQFRLAKLYEADDWGTARDLMVRVLETERRNPEYLAYLVEMLLRHNRKNEARTWLEKLEKLEPESERVGKLRQQVN